MKKNIDWLKVEIHKELESWYGVEGGIDGDGINEIMLLINQLDEPEVLSQELPVIPKFVADWIESRKNNYPFDVIGVYQRMNESFANEQTREVLSWIHETELNRNSFARAWLDGYTIEEDTKYRVQIGGHFVKFDSEGNMSTTTRSNSITTKPKLHSLGFNLDKAVESGLVKVEELEE